MTTSLQLQSRESMAQPLDMSNSIGLFHWLAYSQEYWTIAGWAYKP